MKSKMDATFNLGYPQREEFQNNVLSWLPKEYTTVLKTSFPKKIPKAAAIKQAYHDEDLSKGLSDEDCR
jgi:hypothetical protein